MSGPLQKPLFSAAAATVLLLLVPAVAMQFTQEVAWGPGDFVMAGALLFGAFAGATLGLQHVTSKGRRAALLAGIVAGLAVVWAELAVGLFG